MRINGRALPAKDAPDGLRAELERRPLKLPVLAKQRGAVTGQNELFASGKFGSGLASSVHELLISLNHEVYDFLCLFLPDAIDGFADGVVVGH